MNDETGISAQTDPYYVTPTLKTKDSKIIS